MEVYNDIMARDNVISLFGNHEHLAYINLRHLIKNDVSKLTKDERLDLIDWLTSGGKPTFSEFISLSKADRIYDVLNALDLYPKEAVNATQLLFINFGEKETAYCLPSVTKARKAGIRTEMYPDGAKMKKQMGYANAKNIPFVALAGENEINEGKLTLKNMATGEQTMVTPDELIAIVTK
jgi:histidyl-tRNA synthetase